MRLFVLFSLCVSSVVSQNLNQFPLWGSSWIIAQGNNKRVFPSALPLMPDKLALVEFRSSKSIYISYANLNHCTYRCTAELLENIRLQFKDNRIDIPFDSIVTGNTVNVAYRPFDDTLWTGDPDMLNYLSKFQSIGRIVGNTDSTFGQGDRIKLKNTPSFFRSKPVYYGVRYFLSDDEDRYSIKSVDDDGGTIFLLNEDYFSKQSSTKEDMYSDFANTNLQSLSNDPPFVSYRKGDYIYEYIPCNYEFKTSNIGYWQVHLHPEVCYYPRDPFDGHGLCFDELKMDSKTANEKRSESLANPTNLDLKYYRNPYLSDSASVIISFAFCNIPNTDMTQLNAVLLMDSTVQINHYPPLMYRVSDAPEPSNWISYQASLYKLYSKDPIEEEFNSRLDSRCPSWEVYDLKNADLIFPPKLQEPNRLVRDRNIDDGLFNYNGCPCTRISSLKNLTPVQLKRFVFLTPPMCDRLEMVKAINLYDQFFPYLKSKSDQNLILQKKAAVIKVIQERDGRAAKAGGDWSAPNERCPETWVDIF